MTSWFDENTPAPTDDKKEDVTKTPETEPENEGSPFATNSAAEEKSESAADEQKEDAGWKAAEDTQSSQWSSVPPVYPQSTVPWSTPTASGNPMVGGQTREPGSTTYHYGVNAPDPVPNNTNSYNVQPHQNQSGGYNPPNGYNNTPNGGYYSYNWQQTPPPPPVQPGMQPKPPKKKKNGAAIAIASLSAFCAVAIITLSVLLAVSLSENGVKNGTNTGTSSSSGVNKNAPSLKIAENDADAQGLSTRSIVEMNLNSTVVITIYNRQSSFGFGGGSNLAEVGAASGIVMSEDGYIITNWHVVIDESTGKAYERLDVKTYDGTVYKGAEVIGADQDTDLAVIKISAAKLTTAKFGDSSALKLGDKIVAIGNAGGLEYTTTQGIVSGLARDVYEDTGYSIKCLQIDAAINPGNSGGPLLNAQGQVVGVNSAKIVAEGYEGLGFSIPIKEAKIIVDDIVKYGFVKNRVMLGITGRDITQPGYEGFQIQTIDGGSVLANTEVKIGDIITKIQDVTVQSGAALRNELSKFKVGDKITLTLMRVDSRTGSKDSFSVTCTLKEYDGGK